MELRRGDIVRLKDGKTVLVYGTDNEFDENGKSYIGIIGRVQTGGRRAGELFWGSVDEVESISHISLSDLELHNWWDIHVKVNLEERIEDIHVAVLYESCGDQFLFVQTNEGKQYKYGYWCHRNYEKRYKDLKPVGEDPNSDYVRNPVMENDDVDETGKGFGIAGKRILDEEDCLGAEKFLFVFVNGEEVDIENVYIDEHWDHSIDGMYGYMPLDQFDDDAFEKQRESNLNWIRRLREKLDEAEKNIMNYSLPQLYALDPKMMLRI